MCTTSNQGFWKNITNYINLSLAISSEDFIEPEEERSFVSSEQEEGFIEVRISITDDLRLEPNETFTVMISSTERDSSIVTFIESQYLSEVIINDNDREFDYSIILVSLSLIMIILGRQFCVVN